MKTEGVVITGIGCVTPIGNDAPAFWQSLLTGSSGAGPITSFDVAPYRSSTGCEVKGFALEIPGATGGEVPSIPRASQLALAASREALQAAGLLQGQSPDGALQVPPGRLAVSVGTTMGELNFLDRLQKSSSEDGGDGPPWGEVVTLGASTIARTIAVVLGIDGPQYSLPAACSAGNYAIGYALDLIRRGRIDAALAGGSEAFSESAFAGFTRLGAMSPDVCRPFDRNRKGLLLGEGAAFLVLEREDFARKRNARPLARVLGYGLSCDAHHITGPHPDGRGAAACMQNALWDAGIGPEKVDYINAHGTGTRPNDKIETLAIRSIFGKRQVPVSSIKALTGHTMGAASAIEAVSCILALQNGILPPTWNYQEPDPECDLDVIPNAPREASPAVVINNSYAFGGNNACVAFGRI